MSATISAKVQAWGMRDERIIMGVCARIAGWAGVSVWVPRAAFLVFGVLHWALAVIAYFVLSRVFCRTRTANLLPVQDGPPPSAVRDRFSALDARLAAMEASTLQQENTLRRAFRDLERS